MECLLGAAVLVATAVIPLITPLGISGVRDINGYGYAFIFYLFVRSYATTAIRRRLLLVALALVALAQFVPIWRVWTGENNRSFMAVGTFYWHNQFGIFSAAIALMAASYAARSSRIDDVLAWITAALFVAQTLLSQSRGALLALIVGTIVLLIPMVTHRMWASCGRVVAVAALGYTVSLGFLAYVGQPANASGVVAKETLNTASHFRTDAFRAAAHVIVRDAATSSGFGTYALEAPQWIPAGHGTSRWVHSAELQAFTDGGLALGGPVLAVLAGGLLRWIMAAKRAAGKHKPFDFTAVGAAAAGTAMLLHTSMDFDSQYPSLLAMLALFLALAAPAVAGEGPHEKLWQRRVSALAVLSGVAAVLAATLMVSAYWSNTIRLDQAQASVSSSPTKAAALAERSMRNGLFRDPRAAVLVVQLRDAGAPVSRTLLTKALATSRAYMRLEPSMTATWKRVAGELAQTW